MEQKLLYKHILIALVASAVTYASITTLVSVSNSILIIDSIISGTVLSILIFLVNLIIRFSKFSLLSVNQQIINYCAIAILFVICWFGAEYYLLYLFTENWDFFIPLIPIRILVALLLYSLIVMFPIKNYVNNPIELLEDVSEEDAKNPTSEIIERIAVKNGNNKIEVLLISDIIHLQAEGDYVMIFSTKGKFLKEQTMKSFQDILPSQFVRIHRSDIINIEYIAQIELHKQGQVVKLKNGAEVKASVNGYKTLKTALSL